MIMISNILFNYIVPAAQGLFMGIGMFITFEVLKDKAFESYKNHQLKKFQKDIILIREERDNKSN